MANCDRKQSKKHRRIDEEDEDKGEEGKSGKTNDDKSENRISKALRHDIEIPTSEVDEKLAEKLDNILKISFNQSRPKFLTNKPRSSLKQSKSNGNDNGKGEGEGGLGGEKKNIISPLGKLTSRGLTKEQIKERVGCKYNYLTREPKVKVNLVKILSASESMKLGKEEAKKQIVRELELSSATKNLEAIKEQAYRKFKFTDGYE